MTFSSDTLEIKSFSTPTAHLPTLKGQNPREEGDTQSQRAIWKKHLRVDRLIRVGENEPVQVRALVDTGAEISLMRQGVLPPVFYVSSYPIRILVQMTNAFRGLLEVSGN